MTSLGRFLNIVNKLNPLTRRSYSSNQTIMNVFDRNIKKSQKNLAAIDPEYKNYEYLFEEVGYRVADRVFDIKRTFEKHLFKLKQKTFLKLLIYSINILFISTLPI